MTTEVDEARLDDSRALSAVDPEDMLRAVATSAAQVRAGLSAARPSTNARICRHEPK